MLKRFMPLFCSAILAFSPVYAADIDLEDYKKTLISLNKDIGTYYFIEDYISKDITDSDYQKVGTVQDFLINNQGEVQTLVSELNTLDVGQTTLNLAFHDVSADEGHYTLAFKAAEMEEQLAMYLAGIETAAGDDSEPLISARRLHGRNILLPTGEPIGQVDHVITDKETQQVVGVLMKDLSTRPEYERFALPYPQGLRIKNTGFSNNLELSEELVEVIESFTAEGVPN